MWIFVALLCALALTTYLVQINAYKHIRVIFANNTNDMIKRERLEELIVSGSITKFFRSTGWVTIGVDPTRIADHGNLRDRREIATC